MRRFITFLGALLLVTAANEALAHNSNITISSHTDNQTIIVDSLPINIIVEGTISHGPPGTVNNQKACISVDGGLAICEPNYVTGLGSMSSRGYNITVPISSPGPHTLQATTANPSNDHRGISSLITINVILTTVTCDEKDPPAFANEYLNSLNLPPTYATYRGQIIRVIAFNHSNGAYGSCHYDYDAVLEDVDDLLAQLGF